MDKRVLIDLVRGNPAFQQGVDQIEQKFSDAPISLGDINGLIKFVETVLDHPDKYSQLRAAAITDGKLDGSELPQQFQPQILVPLLVALYGIRDRLQGKEEEAYARGGLTGAARKLRAEGRGGDTVLAHINPKEAAMLKGMGASGTINPKTGLPEYGWSWKSIISTILPVAIDYFAPGLGSTIGEAFGASGTAASALGGSLLGAGLGAGTAALTGGNIGQGALSGGALGALSGGGGEWLGSKVGGMFGQSLSPTVASALGGTLIGGGLGAINGQDIMQSALQGGIGGAISGSGQTIANKLGAEGAMNAGIQSAARAGGNLLTIGADPQQALISGGLAGLATGLMYGTKPSSQAVANTANQNMPWKSGDTAKAFSNALPSNPSAYTGSATSAPASTSSSGPSLGTLGMLGLGAAAIMGGSSSNTQQAVTSSPALSQSQQEYFNRPALQFDWNAIARDAAQANQDVGTYVARNWNSVTGGKYSSPIAAKAQGGALSKIAYLAQGAGSGRDDTIDARLSDGEYVIDAETVALLGDGSTKEGARKLDQMRSELRKQKGKKLIKGEFSISAKSPLSYIKKGAK